MPIQISGLDIAGHCLPAAHVSGDFFQYFESDDTLTIALADVTGHAMAAAIPAVMVSGILDNQMEIDQDLEVLYTRLNRSLYRILEPRTFVCLTMGQLNLSTHTFRLSNAGGLYPYLYKSDIGKLIEQEIDAYPLGITLNTQYESLNIQIHPGDYLIFCSDGLVEAQNLHGNQFGFDGLAACIQDLCKNNPNAQTALDHILRRIETFIGNGDQQDDITCVVLKIMDC